MKAPTYQQPPLDPAFAQLQAKNQQDDIAALTQRARDDTASLLARYGTMAAIANANGASTTGSPLIGKV